MKDGAVIVTVFTVRQKVLDRLWHVFSVEFEVEFAKTGRQSDIGRVTP